jgi:hypothetical protein
MRKSIGSGAKKAGYSRNARSPLDLDTPQTKHSSEGQKASHHSLTETLSRETNLREGGGRLSSSLQILYEEIMAANRFNLQNKYCAIVIV